MEGVDTFMGQSLVDISRISDRRGSGQKQNIAKPVLIRPSTLTRRPVGGP